MKINIGTVRKALRLAQRAWREYTKIQNTKTGQHGNTPSRAQPTRPRASSPTPSPGGNAGGYPGDFTGTVDFIYSPRLDGDPDPGEVVWTWVPYEEDYSQGKDRPVLLIGKDGNYLLALMLTSKDKNNATQHNSDYLDIGTGAWDKEGRPSEVKLNRVIRVAPEKMRREGAVMDETTFNTIKEAFKNQL